MLYEVITQTQWFVYDRLQRQLHQSRTPIRQIACEYDSIHYFRRLERRKDRVIDVMSYRNNFV